MKRSPSKAIFGVFLTALLSACGKPDIKHDCNLDGRGELTCHFSNKGNAKGSVCVVTELYFSQRPTLAFEADAELCSGLVESNDVRETRKLVSFGGKRPVEVCQSPAGLSWTETCSFRVGTVEELKSAKAEAEKLAETKRLEQKNLRVEAVKQLEKLDEEERQRIEQLSAKAQGGSESLSENERQELEKLKKVRSILDKHCPAFGADEASTAYQAAFDALFNADISFMRCKESRDKHL